MKSCKRTRKEKKRKSSLKNVLKLISTKQSATISAVNIFIFKDIYANLKSRVQQIEDSLENCCINIL